MTVVTYFLLAKNNKTMVRIMVHVYTYVYLVFPFSWRQWRLPDEHGRAERADERDGTTRLRKPLTRPFLKLQACEQFFFALCAVHRMKKTWSLWCGMVTMMQRLCAADAREPRPT